MFSIYEETTSWARDNKLSLWSEPRTTSTNDIAKREALGLKEDFKFYVTDEQSAGRGRGRNTWSNSARGSALLSTWSFATDVAPQPISAPLVGLAVFGALRKVVTRDGLSMKAPNDIFLNDKKILGLLLETIKQGNSQRLVIGLGLNVFANPDDVDTAGSLGVGTTTDTGTGTKIDKKIWRLLLDQLHQDLKIATHATGQAALSDQARADLLHALNENPLLKTPYTSVSPFGDLATAEGTQSWHDI